VGRWHQQGLVLAAALGVSGCLLFADPINKAPTVTLSTDVTVFYRNQQPAAEFWATVKDDRDATSLLQLRWHEFSPKNPQDPSCLAITAKDWPGGIPTAPLDRPYAFTAKTLEVKCLCAQVTDSNGASGYACSLPIMPKNLPLVAVLSDDSGALSNQPRALCSQIHLSAQDPGEPARFSWTLQYSGTYPTGKAVQLAPCAGVTTNLDAHRCLDASVPGTYTVTLTAQDAVDPNAATVTSQPFVIPVEEDSPPCIRQSEPGVSSQLTQVSRSSDPGRTFKASNVADDCEPYPMVSGSTGTTQFVWFVLDPSSSSTPTWARQTNTSPSFTVSQANFPNARPGDTIKVRLEVRDSQVQASYSQDRSYAVCPESTDICCGPSGCSGTNACVRWTTWTVQFQP
jgi:hypothetical protein